MMCLWWGCQFKVLAIRSRRPLALNDHPVAGKSAYARDDAQRSNAVGLAHKLDPYAVVIVLKRKAAEC